MIAHNWKIISTFEPNKTILSHEAINNYLNIGIFYATHLPTGTTGGKERYSTFYPGREKPQRDAQCQE